MTLEQRIECLRADIKRLSRYGSTWRIEVQVLDSASIHAIKKALTMEELLWIDRYVIVSKPPTELVTEQVMELPFLGSKSKKAVPKKPLPPVFNKTADNGAGVGEKAMAAAAAIGKGLTTLEKRFFGDENY